MSDEYWTIKMNIPEGARYLDCHDYGLRRIIADGILGSIASSLKSSMKVFDYCTLDGEAIEDSIVSGSDYATYGAIGAFSDNAMRFLVGMGVPESFFYPLTVKNREDRLMHAFVPERSFLDVDLDKSVYGYLMYVPESGKYVPIGLRSLAIRRTPELRRFGGMFVVAFTNDRKLGQLVVSNSIKVAWEQGGFQGIRFIQA